MPIVDKNKKATKSLNLDIKDSEFILRHLMESQYTGLEIEQAASTLEKIKGIHKKLMETSIEV